MENEQEDRRLFVDGERVFASLSGGMLHIMVRATSRETYLEQALTVGLLKYANEGSPAVIDPETGEVLVPEVLPSGPLIPSSGVTITELGPHVLVAGTYDEEGNEITPPVVDSRYHVNAWIGPAGVERGAWKVWGVAWTQNGQPVNPNNAEEGVAYGGIELIDPLTVSSPSNVLL